MTTMRESCKPKRTTEAPWGVWDLPAHTTTYASAYMQPGPMGANPAIRPQAQHPWTTEAKFNTRSTAQDSFQFNQASPSKRESCKPIREYEPMEWPQRITTTNQAMFIPYYAPAKREPFRPKRKEVDGSRFDTRSTAQDSFAPFPDNYRPRAPIYPAEKPYVMEPFACTSTSRAAYVPHSVQPYIAAKKPPPSMGQDGIMA